MEVWEVCGSKSCTNDQLCCGVSVKGDFFVKSVLGWFTEHVSWVPGFVLLLSLIGLLLGAIFFELPQFKLGLYFLMGLNVGVLLFWTFLPHIGFHKKGKKEVESLKKQ